MNDCVITSARGACATYPHYRSRHSMPHQSSPHNQMWRTWTTWGRHPQWLSHLFHPPHLCSPYSHSHHHSSYHSHQLKPYARPGLTAVHNNSTPLSSSAFCHREERHQILFPHRQELSGSMHANMRTGNEGSNQTLSRIVCERTWMTAFHLERNARLLELPLPWRGARNMTSTVDDTVSVVDSLAKSTTPMAWGGKVRRTQRWKGVQREISLGALSRILHHTG